MTGEVKILNNYLSTKKGEDIQMVYNRTFSGLNAELWYPNFAFPAVR